MELCAADPFTCWLCGCLATAEGKRSWCTKLLAIVTFTWAFEFWYRYCPRCMARINAIAPVVIGILAIGLAAVTLYATAR